MASLKDKPPHPDALWDPDSQSWAMPESLSQSKHLKSLGNQNTQYKYDGADASLLETFPNPLTGVEHESLSVITIENDYPEFTSLCPKTGQPDFAAIVVTYSPRDLCVESKSWKLYLGSYRGVAEFHEACVERIHNDLWTLLNPRHLRVEGRFTPRGGIKFWPVKEQWGAE